MSYRSDVCIVCEPKAYEMLMDTIDNEGLEPDSIQTSNELFKIEFNSIKWYEEESEIAAVMEVLNKLDSDEYNLEDGFGYEYLRIGEETEDTDRRENIGCGGELYLNRSFWLSSEFTDIDESPKSEWQRYCDYLTEWAKDHNTEDCKGMSPVCFDEWSENENEGFTS